MMITEKLITRYLVQRHAVEQSDQLPEFEAREPFSLHLGHDLKVQVDRGDRLYFEEDAIVLLNRDNGALQHAVPLQSVIYLSTP